MRIIKFIVTAGLGAVYGLLFAQKPGKKLRAELKKAKNPAKTLFGELKKVDLEAYHEMVDWAKASPELKKVLESGRQQFDSLVKQAKDLGEDAAAAAQKELEALSRNAKKAAEDLKKNAVKKGKSLVKKAKTKAASTKKKGKKSVKSAKK